MTVRPAQPRSPRARVTWTATRTIQALAALCVALAMMCLALALLWQRQHEAVQCWRAVAQYHLHPDACSAEPDPAREVLRLLRQPVDHDQLPLGAHGGERHGKRTVTDGIIAAGRFAGGNGPWLPAGAFS